MKRRVTLYKNVGPTPLETVETWRALHPAYIDVPLSYAGRLDPLAEGKLLMLIGEECKRQKAYAGLDKEYDIEVLLGASTDTGDLMGLPSLHPVPEIDTKILTALLKDELGTHERAYPAFSSKTVGGVPLFMHTLAGTLPASLPMHRETIHRIRLGEKKAIHAKTLLAHIEDKLARVTRDTDPRKASGADFRRTEIIARWRELLSTNDTVFPLISLSVTTGPGAYMRSLAPRIASALGSGGLAFSIQRTKLGRYRTCGPLRFWLPRF